MTKSNLLERTCQGPQKEKKEVQLGEDSCTASSRSGLMAVGTCSRYMQLARFGVQNVLSILAKKENKGNTQERQDESNRSIAIVRP